MTRPKCTHHICEDCRELETLRAERDSMEVRLGLARTCIKSGLAWLPPIARGTMTERVLREALDHMEWRGFGLDPPGS